MADGFLSRWARRKEAVRKGQEVAPEPQPMPKPPQAEAPLPQVPAEKEVAAAAPEAPPTLADTESLDAGSDFTRFVRPDVAPEVKNAALKKLFADPHFNTMDGLDVYIDDYNKADPLPPEMLRRLAGAKFLKLFDEDAEQPPASDAETMPREAADDPAAQTVAQSGPRTGTALPPAADHADPDLRLQQDDAPGPAGPGAGAR